MWDVLLIAVTIAFFAMAIAYAYACERLGCKGRKR